jgi:hypothetical protein
MKELALTRIFTDEDFARIETQNLKKQVTNTKSRKRQATEGFERTDLVKREVGQHRNDLQKASHRQGGTY